MLKRCIIIILALVMLIGSARAFESITIEPKVLQHFDIEDYYYITPYGRSAIAILGMMEFSFASGIDFECIDLYGDTFTGKHSGVFNVTFRYIDNDVNPWVIVNLTGDASFVQYTVIDDEMITADMFFAAMSEGNSDGVYKNDIEYMEKNYEDMMPLIEREKIMQKYK